MRNLIVITFFLISAIGYSQTIQKHTYLITISGSNNADQRKENIEQLKDFFETNNCVYHVKKNAFLITTENKYNIKQLKIDLENTGSLVIENIKQNGAQLKKNIRKVTNSTY